MHAEDSCIFVLIRMNAYILLVNIHSWTQSEIFSSPLETDKNSFRITSVSIFWFIVERRSYDIVSKEAT